MDWLSWGVALTELTTAGTTAHRHRRSPLKRRRPPKIHRPPLPSPLVPATNPSPLLPASNDTSTNNLNLLHTTTALQFLRALSKSPRLQLEASPSFITSLLTITNILSRTLLTNPTATTTTTTPTTTATAAETNRRTTTTTRNHTTTSHLATYNHTRQQNDTIALTTALHDTKTTSYLQPQLSALDVSIARLQSQLVCQNKTMAKTTKKTNKALFKINKVVTKLNQWKHHSAPEHNATQQWNNSVLERNITQTKQRIRKLQSKRIKLEREKRYYLPASQLKSAQQELLDVETNTKAAKDLYNHALVENCKAQAYATRCENKTKQLNHDSNALRQEHQEWTRNNTPRPDIGQLLPEAMLPTFINTTVDPKKPETATIVARIAALESQFERRLKELSIDVRKAYQQDDGDEESVKEDDGETVLVAHKTKSDLGNVYDDALGGMASWTLRMAFLRLRVALDGAVAKMKRNQKIVGYHRSEKMLVLGTHYVREEVVPLEEQHTATTNTLRSPPPPRVRNGKDTTVPESPELLQLTSNDIVARMASLVKTLKLMQCADRSMQVRTEILASAATLNKTLREFDAVLVDREKNDIQKKGSGMKKRDPLQDHVDFVLGHLQLQRVFTEEQKQEQKQEQDQKQKQKQEQEQEQHTEDQHAPTQATHRVATVSVRGLGNKDNIPLFLRTSSTTTILTNLDQLDIHQVRTRLDDLWASRMGTVTASGGMLRSRLFVDTMSRNKSNKDSKAPFDQFMQQYFVQLAVQNGTTALVEAYSFWWSAQVLCSDASTTVPGISFIRMSRHVVAQVLPEMVVPDAMKMLRSLRSFVVAISRREMGKPEAATMVYKDNLIASLGRFFPTAGHETQKEHHDLANMVLIVEQEYHNSCVVPVSWLFSIGNNSAGQNELKMAVRADENSSMFIEAALGYYVEGSTRYARSLLELLHSLNPAGDGKLTPSMCEYCLHHVLARFHVSREQVLTCICIGMGLMGKHSENGETQMVDDALVKKPINSSLVSAKKKVAAAKKKNNHNDNSSGNNNNNNNNKLARPTGLNRLPEEWMNPLGADQSTRRMPIDVFWRNLVAHHLYRPARFWFDGAEPMMRHTEHPVMPLDEMKCVRVMLGGGGRSDYNVGNKRKYLFADKVGKDIVVVEAAATCGYQFVRGRTPRRGKRGKEREETKYLEEKKEEEEKEREREAEKRKRRGGRARGRRRSSCGTENVAKEVSMLFSSS